MYSEGSASVSWRCGVFSAGWCGRLEPWWPCPASPSPPSAPSCPATQTPTNRVGFPLLSRFCYTMLWSACKWPSDLDRRIGAVCFSSVICVAHWLAPFRHTDMRVIWYLCVYQVMRPRLLALPSLVDVPGRAAVDRRPKLFNRRYGGDLIITMMHWWH